MLFSYTWLNEYVKGRVPKADKLAELLNMHAFEVEEVQKKGEEILLDIAVLPNRAHDCLNHVGMAREVAAITGKKFMAPKTRAIKAQKGSLAPLKVVVKEKRLVPRYTALVIEGVQVQPSPKWLAERLEALGVNSINNIVDLTNYIMLETGQPLHAFDYDTIQGHRMKIRQTKEGETIQTLDERILQLPKGALGIEDAQGLIDLAGIKGGKRTAVSPNTKNIVLQAANFDARTIYNACATLNYRSDAGQRYAHGMDPNLTIEALGRVLFLLAELKAGGEVVQIVDAYPKKRMPGSIRLNLDYVESLLGIAIPAQRAKTILRFLGCVVKEQGGNIWEVKPPTQRLDLQAQEDLVEEIGRIVGFENIPAAQPLIPLSSPRQNSAIAWENIVRDRLAALGFTEVYNYSFFKKGSGGSEQLVELENPINEEARYLRSNLVENLSRNVATNQKTEKQIRLFEIGKVFRKTKKGVEETKMLGGVLAGGEGFYEGKGVLDFIFSSLGLSDMAYDEFKPTPEKSFPTTWNAPRTAAIRIGPSTPSGAKKEIGFLGEISQKVTAFQIDMERLAQAATEEIAYRAPSRFPSSIRDIAILVPKNAKVADLMNAINSVGQALIQDVDLFDMYEGAEMAEGKKNLAFRIVYQANDRTLTNKEVDELHDRVIRILEQNPEWEARK